MRSFLTGRFWREAAVHAPGCYSLFVDRQIEHGWVVSATAIWSLFQIDQKCLGRSGGLCPGQLPLFQATVYEALG
jgi:hypothetical protein